MKTHWKARKTDATHRRPTLRVTFCPTRCKIKYFWSILGPKAPWGPSKMGTENCQKFVAKMTKIWIKKYQKLHRKISKIESKMSLKLCWKSIRIALRKCHKLRAQKSPNCAPKIIQIAMPKWSELRSEILQISLKIQL